MTILESTIKLFAWFKENHSFSLDEPLHLKRMKINSDESLACFKIALERLEKIEIINGVEIQGRDAKFYVLEKEMQNFHQNVDVSGGVAFKVAASINDFCAIIKDNIDLCDPTGITERDIDNLVLIINYYKEAASNSLEMLDIKNPLADLGDDNDNKNSKNN